MLIRTMCVVAVLTGCGADDTRPTCDGVELGTSFVAVRPPAEAVAVPGDDTTLVVWHEPDLDAGRATLHARCTGPDGTPIGPDAVLALEQYAASAFRAARRPDGRYAVVFGQWPRTSGAPHTIHLVDLDCAAGWSTPRLMLGPAQDLNVAEVVATDSFVAFTHTASDATGLVIDHADGTTSVTVDTIYGAGTLATSGDEIAVAWSGDDGPKLAFYDTRGRLLSGPMPTSGVATDLCWDGAEWAATFTAGQEVTVGWLDPAGEPGLSVMVSDGEGRSFSPALACDRGQVFAVWQRNTGGFVSGMDLYEAVIALAEVAPDATVVSVVDVEPPSGRISMLPVVSVGERVVTSWTSFGDTWYEQRVAASAPCR